MQRMKGSKHPRDRTLIYLGADTRYHSSRYTFAPSPPPPTLTYKTYHYWRLSRILFWYTCCICLRHGRESTGCFSYLSVQCRVPSWAARIPCRKCKWEETSVRVQNSFRHITAHNYLQLTWADLRRRVCSKSTKTLASLTQNCAGDVAFQKNSGGQFKKSFASEIYNSYEQLLITSRATKNRHMTTGWSHRRGGRFFCRE